ncbi:hypothetical protein D3C80_1616510 [compost metagenome]
MPSKSGNEKSERIMSNCCVSNASTKDAFPTARVTTGGGDMREICSSINSASMELSSRRRSLQAFIRSASYTIATRTRRRFIQKSPENAKVLYCLEKFIEFDWFDNEGVYTQFIAFHKVLLFSRRSQHNHGNVSQMIAAFYHLQDLQPVDFR